MFPEWITPMAPTLTEKRFTAPEWVFERKFDGIRLLAFKRGETVQLLSRNRLPQQIPLLAAAIAVLPCNELILDGEVTWGRSLAYHVFDLPWRDGDLRPLSLDERRTRLDTLPLEAPLHRVVRLTDAEPWERACRDGWEGVIAKRRDSVYESRRSPHWLKMKCEVTADFIVGGFTDPQGTRVGLGAILLGQPENGEFVYVGKVGTGFDTALLIELRRRLEPLEIPAVPFTKAVGLPRVRAHWVTPRVVVHVAFLEWTPHGKLRHSRLLGVRP